MVRASTKPVIYIAGPLSPIVKINRTLALNVKLANTVAIQLFEATEGKADIIIPHNMHTPLCDDVKCVTDDYYLALDLALMDAYINNDKAFCLYLMRDWAMSRGAKIEHDHILGRIAGGIHVAPIIICHDALSVKKWLAEDCMKAYLGGNNE